MVGVGAAAVLCWVACPLLFRADPRRMRLGLVLLLAVLTSAASLVLLAPWGLPAGTALLLVAGALGLIGTLALGATVVVGALAVSRQDSGLAGRALSGLGGLALLLAPWAAAGLAGTDSGVGLVAAVLGGAIAAHLGLAFLVFLGASLAYQLFPPHRESSGIIVLGSTLHAGSVPPLLRRRLERAVAERARLLALGLDPLLVPSGGKGDAQTPAESEAMAAFLTGEAGVPAARVRAETASRTTEENLVLSHRLLEAAGHQGPFLISTSGYHAFRAGLLARRLGFQDAAIGGPAPLAHLPTATLREFVLTLACRARWAVALLPVSLGLVGLLVRCL